MLTNKDLKDYINRQNILRGMLGLGAIREPLNQDDCEMLLENIECDMSPENRTCDGELCKAEIRQKDIYLKSARNNVLMLRTQY